MRYRSKPQEVEAIQWTGDNWDEIRGALPQKVLLDFGTTWAPSDQPDAEYTKADQLMLLAGKDGAQDWVPVPLGHWLVHQPNDISDVWPVEDFYFRAKYEASPLIKFDVV